MMPPHELLKHRAARLIPALLACVLMAACSVSGEDASLARDFEVQELAAPAPSAGCWYTTSAESKPVMVVHYGSHDRNPPDTAMLRIDGVDHVLEKFGSEAGEPFRYGNDLVQAEAFDFRNVGPECSGECEGSFHEARLRIDYVGQSTHLDVLAHCGA